MKVIQQNITRNDTFSCMTYSLYFTDEIFPIRIFFSELVVIGFRDRCDNFYSIWHQENWQFHKPTKPCPTRPASDFAFTCFAIENNFRIMNLSRINGDSSSPTDYFAWDFGFHLHVESQETLPNLLVFQHGRSSFRQFGREKCQSREVLLWYVLPIYTLPLNCIGDRMDFSDCFPCISRRSGRLANIERAETNIGWFLYLGGMAFFCILLCLWYQTQPTWAVCTGTYIWWDIHNRKHRSCQDDWGPQGLYPQYLVN